MKRSMTARGQLVLVLALLAAAAPKLCAEAEFHMKGQLAPASRAVVVLDGISTPFNGAVLASERGQFEFKGLRAGTYTLIVAVPNRGEIRRTVEIGPGVADAKSVVAVDIQLDERLFERRRGEGTVPLKELALPPKARKAWAESLRQLARHNRPGAIASLQRAVELAPEWSMAWNNLGTLYYMSEQYPLAERAFRTALECDPASFEARVNLGGVLLTLGRPDEAYVYNLYCVLERSADALANAQLGLNNFALGRLRLARRYLEMARRIDPGHFSHPQLTLAELDLREGDRRACIADLEEFLRYHPDDPARDRIREWIDKLKRELAEML
jgi:tetratricopeptide (TPR) repeat protein